MDAIFSSPWKPSFAGAPVPPCPFVADLAQYNAVPNKNCATSLSWSEMDDEKLKKEIELTPPLGRDAMRETVVAIWRLKEKEERADAADCWQKSLRAWLVSAAQQ